MINLSKTTSITAATAIAGSAFVGLLAFMAQDHSSLASTPAAAWFQDQNYDLTAFKDMDAKEAALRLNQAVYSFCRSGTSPAELDDMYFDCVGQCGGFSYVLRGLLDEIGIENRYANLHNIPMQGNHSAVEALVDDRWIFIDPTFGVSFSDDRTPEGRLLSLDEINFAYREKNLEEFVLQARKDPSDAAGDKLTALYDEVFSHEFMDLRNYQVAERIDYGLEGRLLNLDIPLSLSSGFAEIGGDETTDPESLEAVWLDATNQTLLDDHLDNDVSFNTSFLYPGKLVTLSFYDLKPGQPYRLELLIRSNSDDQTLQIANLGKGLQIDRNEHSLEREGLHPVEVRFTPKRSTGTIMLRSVGVSKLRLFDIEVAEAGASVGLSY